MVGSLIDINGVPTSVGTHYGDANLNGTANFAYFEIIQNNFNGTGRVGRPVILTEMESQILPIFRFFRTTSINQGAQGKSPLFQSPERSCWPGLESLVFWVFVVVGLPVNC